MFPRLPLFALVATLGIGASALSCDNELYTVVSGDVCDSIASKLGIPTAALLECNPQIDAACDNLIPGEQLATPLTATSCGICGTFYVVKAGDVCDSIGAIFDVTFAGLQCANPQINDECTNLQIGEVLCII
ncbi:hypothetical protein GYMLUDRAFT_261197 [Collybiopsis luxurians FD-317 M1]|uniref:LysM domain-containing protein n=1 Tax=Collybiopsis luxurians FD-317 M1 TaxID=944289 RepID=A0A0D0BYE4_9AGAR|nr:hypothetical protein GYMLUDRAFT_261197 [Collybiopsis luxurians FD-317 M1]